LTGALALDLLWIFWRLTSQLIGCRLWQAARRCPAARGTVLFADISGFTPLTEALVRTLGPRRGAEELARQLNEV